MSRDTLTYGAVVAGAVFFAGWSTGLGGSFLPNLIFSLAMGIFAALCFWAVKRYAGPKK